MNAPFKPPPITALPDPELKEIRTKDGAGRIITTFEGEHPSVWLKQFSLPPKG
jgi:hypothetical protein